MGPCAARAARRLRRPALIAPGRRFGQVVAIDWSGQAVPRPRGLAVAQVGTGGSAPALLRPAEGWSRPEILDWMLAHADAGTDLLIGLDLSPALPWIDQRSYFPGWAGFPDDAAGLWEWVDRDSAADSGLAASGFLRNAEARRHFRQHRDCGDLFPGGGGRLRVCEVRQQAAGLTPSSCFNLVGAAQVGKSSLTGMRVLHRLGGRVPVWPFAPVPARGPVIVEIYTTIAARAAGLRKGISKIRAPGALDAALAALGSAPHAPLAGYDDHSTDAILSAAWLRAAADRPALWAPAALTAEIARTEGWTFGVV